MTTEHRAVEDVMLSADGELVGPTTSRDWENKTFTITFNRDTKEWLQGAHAQLLIKHPWYQTVGEARQGRLHDLLNYFLNDMINETETRDLP